MALEKKEQSALKRKLVKFVTPLFEDVEIAEPIQEETKKTSKKKKEVKPKTVEDVKKDLKEKVVLSLLDKILYYESIGKDIDYAFNKVVSQMGDINEYIKNIDVTEDVLPEKDKHSIVILIISIVLYVISIIPVMIDSTSFLGLLMSLILIVIATLVFIYYNAPYIMHYLNIGKALIHNKKYEKDDVKKLIEADPRFKTSIGILWAVTAVVYFIISFWSADWHITWLIFLIGMCFDNIGRSIFEFRYSKRLKNEEDSSS